MMNLVSKLMGLAPLKYQHLRGVIMQKIQQLTRQILAASLIVTLCGCAGMSRQGKRTAVGAAIGAVGGAALTGGSAAGTIGGAAVGGVIGHEVK